MVIEAGEECDDGSLNGVTNHPCSPDCKLRGAQTESCNVALSPGVGSILLMLSIAMTLARRRRPN